MREAFYTLGICLFIVLVACSIMELIRLIHTFRVRINREAIAAANGRIVKLTEENAKLWSYKVAAEARDRVHAETIARLNGENEALEEENRMLMSNTPITHIRVKRFGK